MSPISIPASYTVATFSVGSIIVLIPRVTVIFALIAPYTVESPNGIAAVCSPVNGKETNPLRSSSGEP